LAWALENHAFPTSAIQSDAITPRRAVAVRCRLGDQLVELVDQIEIERRTHLPGWVGEALGDVEFGAVGRIDQLLAEAGQVVLGVEDLQVGDPLGPPVVPRFKVRGSWAEPVARADWPCSLAHRGVKHARRGRQLNAGRSAK